MKFYKPKKNRVLIGFIGLLLFISLLPKNSFAQGETNWVHTYDSVTSGFQSIAYDSQEYLYAGGYIRPNGRSFDGLPVSGYGYEDGLLCKTDTNGNVKWLKTIGAFSTDEIKFVFVKGNKIYIGGDITNSGGMSNFNTDSVSISIPDFASVYNGYVAQFDTAGVFQWVSFVPGNVSDMKMDNYGNSFVMNTDFDSLYLDIVSAAGGNLFHKGLNKIRYIGHVAPGYNGGIAVAVTFEDTINFMGTMYYGSGSTNILLAQLSPVGILMGAEVIGGSGKDFVSGLFTDSVGNLIMQGVWSGNVNCLGTNINGADHRFFFLSIDPSGNINSYDDNDFQFTTDWKVPGKASLVENANHEFMTILHFADTLISGTDTITTHNFGGYEGAGLILKYDANGQLLWYRKFAESTNASNTGHASLFLSKCDANRNFVCGQMNEHVLINSIDYDSLRSYIAFTAQIVDTTYDFTLSVQNFANSMDESASLYPNPANEKFTISWTKSTDFKTIEISDINGRIIYAGKLSAQQTSYSFNQNELKLVSGIYFVKLASQNKGVVKKLIVK